MVIYGKHPILEAIEEGKNFEKILVQKGIKSDILGVVKRYAAEKGFSIQMVPSVKLDKIVKGNHQGIIGFLSLITYYSVDDVLSQIYQKGESPFFLILDEITDVRNFGAIARTAYNTGVHALIIPEKGSASISADAMKTSAGALNKIYVCKEKDLKKTIRNLKNNGIKIIAADAAGSKFPFDIDITIPCSLILGAEGKGINPAFLRETDEMIKIPMLGKLNSYNVSVAAGMILYEALRQKIKV